MCVYEEETSCDDMMCIQNHNIIWTVVDVIIIFLILAGNILTISAIRLSRKISELLSNRYILNLAISDLLVGLTIPYHMAFTIWGYLGTHKFSCIIRFVLLILACSSSIYNLLAIAADRYIAIVLPFHYNRHMCRMIVWAIVSGGWCISIMVATAPIYWNTWSDVQRCNAHCTLNAVLPKHFVNFILTPMFLSIWVAMLLLYFRIWREAREHTKRLKSTTQLQHQQSRKILRENKSVQMVLLILGCFSICWLPYFIIITSTRCVSSCQGELLYEIAFTMAVSNSCMNPIIYAWKSKNFRKAFWCMLKCKSPKNINIESNYITDHVPAGQKKCENGGTQEKDVIEMQDQVGKEVETNSVLTVQTCVS